MYIPTLYRNVSYRAGKKMFISREAVQFSYNLVMLCIFYVQKDKISLQIPKFPLKLQHFPQISLPYYLLFCLAMVSFHGVYILLFSFFFFPSMHVV